jgi:hypothetical protein
MPKILKYTTIDSFNETLFIIGGANETGLIRIGEMSSNNASHTWKTPLIEIDSGKSINFQISALDQTHFALAYSDGTTGYGTVRIGHWNQVNSIVWDTPKTLFQHNPVLMPENSLHVIRLSSIQFALAYLATDDSDKIKLRIGQFSDDSITWLTTSEFVVDGDSCSLISICYVSGFNFLVNYEKNNSIYVRLYSWLGGNNLTALTDPVLVTSDEPTSINCTMLSSTRFLLFWSTDSGGLVRVGNINGSTITWETSSEEFYSTGCDYITATRLTDSYFTVACRSQTNGYGKVRAGFWDGSTIVWIGEIVTFRRKPIRYLSSTALGSHVFLMLYADEGFSNCGVMTKGRLGSLP